MILVIAGSLVFIVLFSFVSSRGSLEKAAIENLENTGKLVSDSVSRMTHDLKVLEDALMDSKKEKVVAIVESAMSIIEKYYEDYKKGILSEEEAKKKALKDIMISDTKETIMFSFLMIKGTLWLILTRIF